MTVSCFMCDKAVSTHDDLFCDKSVDALKKKKMYVNARWFAV